MLRKEKAVCKFLTDKVKEKSFANSLFSIVELSKIEPQLSIASSLALSLLKLSGIISFQEHNFEGIQALNALLDCSNFMDANLEKANLTGSLIRLANCRGANLIKVEIERVLFGESPPLRDLKWSVCSVSFFLDGKKIVSGSHDNTLRMWDAKSGKEIRRPLKVYSFPVFSVSLDEKNISGSRDKTLRI